jgi:hypothetical protein
MYASILTGPAEVIDPNATAKSFVAIKSDGSDAVFNYVDTASSRAGIHNLSYRLAREVVAVIGLGGTGAYVLDLVAKTPVQSICLFDRDRFLQHNAFRAPGAASIDILETAPFKVDYYKTLYSPLRRGITAHAMHLDASTQHLLQGVTFAFVCIDAGEGKAAVIRALEDLDISFVDVGIGVQMVDEKLIGVIRTTTSRPGMRGHVSARVSFGGAHVNNEYDTNIQIAELNALNAALAVLKWKKIRGIYLDLEGEHHSTFTLDGNTMINDDLEEDSDAA